MKIICLIFFVILGLLGNSLYAQEIQVTGTVTDASDGSTLPGVSVVIQGTTVGTTTDSEGNYELSNVPEDAILEFSFIGMVKKEVPVEGRSVIDIEMAPRLVGLDEVIVTAMGISRESKTLSYSVQSISGEDMAIAKETNLVNSLTGRIAGVQVTSGSGGVGGSSRITIRGTSSLTSDNQPLFVVDGVPVSNFSTSVSQ